MSNGQRNLDLIVYGANGFVGKLVCDYINRTYREMKWGIASNDMSALSATIRELKLKDNIPQYVLAANDKESLRAAFARTKVVLCVAGPFLKLGTDIIEACVEAKTHYIDITGEPPFMRKSIDCFHAAAELNHIKIVHACGFDCIPADLGVLVMVEELQRRRCTPKEVRLLVDDYRGSMSTGTMASLINIFEASSMWGLMQMASPFYLNPRSEKTNTPAVPCGWTTFVQAADLSPVSRDQAAKCWTAPWLMQFIDTRVVNRSNALTNWSYGRDFVFTERLKVSNIFKAIMMAVLMMLFHLLLITPIVCKIVQLCIPSNARPSEWDLEHGHFQLLLLAKGQEASSGREVTIRGKINATGGDPGYKQTAKMATESAMCLVHDMDRLPQTYGVLTPSVAMGDQLVQRLNDRGIMFTVDK